MENKYDFLTLIAGHKLLFHCELNLEDVIEIISKYPAELWLDLFSKIEGFLLVQRGADFDPQVFLSENLFPPSTISRTKRNTEKMTAYFSLGQINLLRKLAIAYGNNENIKEIPKIDISKVLLAAHDIHTEYDVPVGEKADLENFAKFIIRSGYINENLDFSSLLARADEMYIEQAKKLFLYPEVTFNDFFLKHVGINPEEAISLSFALATPFFLSKEQLFGQTAIINPKNYFENTILDQGKIDSIIANLAVDFSEVKKEVLKELENLDPATTPIGYSLRLFRKAPLVRLKDGRLVCVSLSCLLQKATQNAVWMSVSSASKDQREKLIIDLTNYRGRLFEEYIKELCSVFESKNQKIKFFYLPPESNKDHEEVGDSILAQESDVLIFEAKSRQFNESFKNTGEWEDDELFINEMIVKAASQIEEAARKIREGVVADFLFKSETIKRIYPVVVTYEPVPMHSKMLRFVRQKVREAGLLTDEVFAPLEVIHVADLERLTDACDTVTIIDLLREKHGGDPHAAETSFHNFFSLFLNENQIISNGRNAEKSKKIFSYITKNLKLKELQKEN